MKAEELQELTKALAELGYEIVNLETEYHDERGNVHRKHVRVVLQPFNPTD